MNGQSRTSLVLCPKKCRSQFCKRCMIGHAVRWREKLRPALKRWRDVSMITLSLDRDQFDSELDGYLHVGRKRLIAELVRKLDRRGLVYSTEWCYSLEFHKSGWPHWHLLVDSGFIDKHVIQRCWGHGNVWISRSRGFSNKDHAINYATKYVMKADAGFPDWALDYTGNLRRFSTSRGLCGTIKKRKARKTGKSRNRKTARQRAKLCHQKTVALRKVEKIRTMTCEGIDSTTTEECLHFIKELPFPYDAEFSQYAQHEISSMLKDRTSNDVRPTESVVASNHEWFYARGRIYIREPTGYLSLPDMSLANERDQSDERLAAKGLIDAHIRANVRSVEKLRTSYRSHQSP